MTAEKNISAGDPGPYTFSIRGTDTDCQDRLQLFSLFSFMQESAYQNAESGGLGASVLDRLGYCWLLIRISIRFDELPHWGETLTVNTWSRGTRALTFLRDYEFFDQDGRRFGGAASEWVIASQDSHRPQRPEHVLPDWRQPEAPRSVFNGPAPRPPLLDNPGQPILTLHADYSDIDRNLHVNNTRYVAWCINAVYASLRPAADKPADIRINGLDINYISEVRLGEKIHCYCQLDDRQQSYRVEARNAEDERIVFRAQVLTE